MPGSLAVTGVAQHRDSAGTGSVTQAGRATGSVMVVPAREPALHQPQSRLFLEQRAGSPL